jgi:hypothetical protein
MAKLNLDLTEVPKWVSDKMARERGPSVDAGEVERRIENCRRYPAIEFRRPRLADLPPQERRALLNPGETRIVDPTDIMIVSGH